jgi:hypothetical protein
MRSVTLEDSGIKINASLDYEGSSTRGGLITLSMENLPVLQRCLPPTYRISATREVFWGEVSLAECIVEGPLMPPWLWRGLRPLPVALTLEALQDKDGCWRMGISMQVDPALIVTWIVPEVWPTLDAMLTELHRP